MTASPPASDPALEPRILFFSGGTALRGASRLLSAWTERSIHLVTPFDSGGSSAPLRRSLGMPAIGDLRNRMLALARGASPQDRPIHDLLAHRLASSAPPAVLRRELGKVLMKLPGKAAGAAHACLQAVGPRFDLSHASVGNLVLAGMYLAEERGLQRAAARFSELVGVRGTVCPVSEDDLHLAAELADGSVVVGQHRITGGGSAESPIRRLFLVRSLEDPTPVHTSASAAVLDLIGEADLICFPVGSFFTSVVASLLPDGIGEAVAASRAPKVYLPNAGGDPEERGWSLEDRVRALALHLAPLDASEIRVARDLPHSRWDPTRYDDAAVVEALARIVGP